MHHLRAGGCLGPLRNLTMTAGYQKNAIVVGNWFGDHWRPNARLSIAAIAERWGIPVIELVEPIGNDDGYGQKLWLDKHCEQFDRVVWFDRDILVRYDCPSLFEIVKEGAFGCTSSHQLPWHIREDGKLLAPLFQKSGETYDFTVDHLNTGVMVFEPEQHAELFGDARTSSKSEGALPFYDEPWLSLAAKKSRRRQLLDKSFNRCGVANLEDFTPKMSDFIWHFCGIKSDEVNSQIDTTLWQVSPLPIWIPPLVATK